jgi:amidophosphoribosyltransferase
MHLHQIAYSMQLQGVHRRVKGAYAVVSLITDKGVVAFRDPHGIRPLCYGQKKLMVKLKQ